MKWIEGKYTDEDRRYNDTSYKCSKCGCIVPHKTNFCSDCGEKNDDTVYKTVFIATYWDNGLEPVITVFDNQENAEKCYSFFVKRHSGCCVDEVQIYSKFLITKENE